MKPFLLLAARDHDQAAAIEYRSILRHTGLCPDDLHHRRLEREPLGTLDLDDYSGVFIGGSSFNVSDTVKSPTQQRVEAEFARVVKQAVDADFPLLGICYGVGTVTTQLGGRVDHQYAEPAGPIPVTLTTHGTADPLLEGVRPIFHAFVGHKEACTSTPPGATLLATGEACPVQMYRVGTNVYVTQFHPEMDADDFVARIRIYDHSGYFEPDELDGLIELARHSPVDGEQHLILDNFVRRYRSPSS